MKKYLYLLIGLVGLSFSSKANPGDTTWVQANISQFTNYGNYDTTVSFPDGSKKYRKVIMEFTLGKYQCPSGSQWCGDWDYTVQNFVMTPGGDTLELGRLITPYANAAAPRTPWSWTQRYYYDVTDYVSLLKNTATIRTLFSGYSGGFTGNIRFAFIEGTPMRDVIGFQRLWHGSFPYGQSTPITNFINQLNGTVPANTQSTEMKFTITGHGGDSLGCAEFCPNTYTVLLNNSTLLTQDFWRDNCGLNELYPQSGTWPLNRANWCPGASVGTFSHTLPVTAGSNYNVNVTFPPYISVTNSNAPNPASYTVEGIVFYYGAMNKNLDASLEDIISPSNYEGHFRENPFVGKPVIEVKNTGKTTINSIIFEYGVEGQPYAYTTWTGTLNSLQDSVIELPEVWTLRQAAYASGNYRFHVKILNVNNTADDDATNDVMSTGFTAAPSWPVKIVVAFRTNNDPDPNNSSVCSVSWKLFDINNNVVAQRTDANMNHLYNDTLTLGPSVYRLVVTDVNGYGLHWWAIPSMSGSIRVKNASNGVNIPLNGNVENNSTYNDDFGAGFTQYFATTWPTGVNAIANPLAGIEAYPSPAQSNVTVNITGLQTVKGTMQLIDEVGRVVLQQHCTNAQQTINVSQFSNGVYTLIYTDDDAPDTKVQTRIVVAK